MFNSLCGKYRKVLGKAHASLALSEKQGVSCRNVSDLGCCFVISLSPLSNCYLTTLSNTFVEVIKPGRNRNRLG